MIPVLSVIGSSNWTGWGSRWLWLQCRDEEPLLAVEGRARMQRQAACSIFYAASLQAQLQSWARIHWTCARSAFRHALGVAAAANAGCSRLVTSVVPGNGRAGDARITALRISSAGGRLPAVTAVWRQCHIRVGQNSAWLPIKHLAHGR